MTFRLIVGLPKPETAQATIDETTPNGMRKAIMRGARESSLIANVFSGAEFNGLSGEDKYVMLAYHALRMLEDSYQREFSRTVRDLTVPPFLRKG